MAIYKYGTFTSGTTAQVNLALGFIPSTFKMTNTTNTTAGATASGLGYVYWDQTLAAAATAYTLGTNYVAGAPSLFRITAGSTTTATGIVPYQSADNALYTPQQAPYTTISGNRAYIGASTNLVITGISKAAQAVVLATHSFTAADNGVTVVTFHGVVGMTQINGLSGVVVANDGVTGTTFTVNINSTNFGTYVAGTAGVTGGFANVITGAPATTLYGNVVLPTAEANLGTIGLIIGTSINGGATVATTDVWSYEAILQSPVTGP